MHGVLNVFLLLRWLLWGALRVCHELIAVRLPGGRGGGACIVILVVICHELAFLWERNSRAALTAARDRPRPLRGISEQAAGDMTVSMQFSNYLWDCEGSVIGTSNDRFKTALVVKVFRRNTRFGPCACVGLACAALHSTFSPWMHTETWTEVAIKP